MGCYVSAGVTGAHLNPAVTLALAVHRRFPVEQGACRTRSRRSPARSSRRRSSIVTYHEALDAFDGGVRQVLGALGTAGIWATYPQPFLSTFPGGFIDQVVGTALLVGVIFGITDARNSPAPAGLAPVVVGLLVVLIGATFGFNSGYAINPARDFGPRLFTFVAGWGGEVFRAGNGWWWVPIVAPCVGGVLGGWAYDACVGHRFPSHTARDHLADRLQLLEDHFSPREKRFGRDSRRSNAASGAFASARALQLCHQLPSPSSGFGAA